MTAVREISDRAVILRDGAKVGDVLVAQTSDAELVRLVSGHRLGRRAAEVAVARSADDAAADVVLAVDAVGGGRARAISLTLHAGEIVGIAGLLGSGSEDLPYILFGARSDATGRIEVGGWSGDASELDPAHAQRLGLALVPADRKQQGAAAELSVETNMLSLVLPSFVRHGVLQHRRLRRAARANAETYDVRPRDPAAKMSALSGGNQQKVVLARWLELGPRVLLLHEPTQGVDVATRAETYEIMRARCRDGVAILWVSTDFDELAAVSHRILVCAGGVIAGSLTPPFSRDQITSEVYAKAAVGGRREVQTTS